MNDITERLRSLYTQNGTDYVQEAADEIDRLRVEVSDLQIGMDGEIQCAKMHIDAYLESNERLRAETDRLTAQITAFKDGWLRVIDTEMVITHTGIAEPDDDYSTAKTKLLKLIDWYVSMRTDPIMNGGWQLVPVEPTPEMLYAAFAADKEYSARMFGSTDAVVSVGAYDHYVAMLAAAPKPEDTK